MVSRMPRLEAVSIAQSTIAPAGWFTARRMSRSAGGTTAPTLPRGDAGATKAAGIGQCAGDVEGAPGGNGAVGDRELIEGCPRGGRQAGSGLFHKCDRRLRQVRP